MAIFSIIMAVFAAISGIIGSSMQNSTNAENLAAAEENREDTQQFNREEADRANQNTINQYNQLYSPAAKYNQLISAGLSPGLFYGTAGGSGGTASSAQASTGAAPIPTMINPMAGMMDSLITAASMVQGGKKTDNETKKTESEIDKITSEIKKIEEETKTEVVSRNFQEVQTQLAKLQLDFENATFEDRVKIVLKQKEELEQTINKTKEEIAGLTIDNQWKNALYQQTYDMNNELKKKYTAEAALTTAKEACAKAEEKLIRQQTKTEREKTKQIEYEVRKLKKIVEEYETYGYKTTESSSWQEALIGGIMQLMHFIVGDEENEDKPVDYKDGKIIYENGGYVVPNKGGGSKW